MYQNPICVKDVKTDILTWYVWSYQGKYPVAEIKNATNAEIKEALDGNEPASLSSALVPNATLLENLHVHTALSEALVTTYTYKPMIGIASKTDSNGVTIYYEYDSSSRLQYIKDHNGNIIEQYDYHYNP